MQKNACSKGWKFKLQSPILSHVLNAKVNTLAQWRANRARLRPLPYIRSGLKVCYRESDIAKYLESRVIIPGHPTKKSLSRRRRAA